MRLYRISLQRGFTYIWILFFVFLLGLGLGKVLEIFSINEQRKKEKELLYIGKIYQNAIKQYYLSGNDQKLYPISLHDLLKDNRYIVVRKYMRKIYLDPITGKDFLIIYSNKGGICGVKSSSTKMPIKKIFKEEELLKFNYANSYQQWEFQYDCNF